MPDRSGTVLNEIKIRSNNRCALRFAETTTKRGFGKLLFSDYFNKKCSLQISSVGTDECVWLGVESAEPCLLSADAIKLGLAKKEEVPHTPFGGALWLGRISCSKGSNDDYENAPYKRTGETTCP